MIADSAALPGWVRPVLVASAIHSGLWGCFIILLPATSAEVYGFAEPLHDLHLWQGAGLFIFLLAVGYSLAAIDPFHHWGLVLLGLLAKTLGAAGMCGAVWQGQVEAQVLWLLPVNDVLWWWPFWRILRLTVNFSRPDV